MIATVNALLRMRQAEETAIASATQWQTTFDAISDGVCLLDFQGRIVRCNQAMARILDNSTQEIIGFGCGELWQNVGNEPMGEFLCDRLDRKICQNKELQINQHWFGVKADPILGKMAILQA